MVSMELLISSEEIKQKVAQVARLIEKEYVGEEVTLIVVMKGAICITADLMRELKIPVNFECIRASSYGMRGIERGTLVVDGLDKVDISSKNILIVDDIFDSGTTLCHILCECAKKNPKTLRSLVLLSKNVKRDLSYIPDYVLFQIENRFVVGFGLDYNEKYRGLPGIYVYTPPT